MKKTGDTYFGVKMDFDALDEKMQRFVQLRNELAELAEELGFETKRGLMVLTMEENDPPAATGGSARDHSVF